MRGPIVPRLDADRFIAWESRQLERFELHLGFVFAFAGGSADHDRIACNVRVALEALYGVPCRTFGSDMKVRVRNDVVYDPDVSVTCGEVRGEQVLLEGPELVVEVLSPSTWRFDLVEKRVAYRTLEPLGAYVIVHADSRRVEIDRRDASGVWRTEVIDEGDVSLPRGALAFAQIYARTALADAPSS